MFERYTEKARRVIFFARYEASQSASPAIEPDHLLLGITRENADLLVKLTQVSDSAKVLRKLVERRVDPAKVISTSVEIPLSMETKAVLTRAHEESEALGHKHIGPEHLLLGLIGEQGSRAAEALQEIGITAERIRNLSPERVSSQFGSILVQQLTKSLFACLEETFEEVHGLYLDKGTSLFETLAGVSAAEASRPIADNCATLAAQVEHVRFYLDVLCDVIRSREVVKIDWKEIWQTVRQVTPEEWEGEKLRLRETYDRTLTTLKNIKGWDGEYEIGGALSILAHTAYHLGGIRQALGAIRSLKNNVE